MAKSKADRVFSLICKMTMIELRNLVRKLEEAGLASAPALQMIAPPRPAVEVPAEEEQTEFSVLLSAVGSSKIHVVKAVKDHTKLEAKEALDFVNLVERGNPMTVAGDLSKSEADELAAKLLAAGATVEIR